MGKFSSANRENAVDIYTILEQREQQKRKKASPAAAKSAVPAKSASSGKAVPQVAPEVPRTPAKKNKKGTLAFFLGCLIFVFVFYIATFIGLAALRSWLVRFEQAQPTVKCQEVFDELFADPDWEKLYELACQEGSSYEGSEAFRAYMEQTVGDTELSYMETSAGLSGDKKYVVRFGEEKLATFTLTDLNKVDTLTGVPDWQLGKVEFFLQMNQSFRILIQEGSTAYVNGTALTDDQVVAIRTSRASDYLPTFAPAPKVQVLEVAGLLTPPEVTVTDAAGQALEVIFDEETGTYIGTPAQPELPEDRKELALSALKTYALYMSGKAGAGEVAKYFDKNSDTYASIMDADLNWVQKGSNYTFTDETVTDYRVYSDDIFAMRVSVKLNITRSEDGSVRENEITQSMFFTKNSAGKWNCYEMTAVDAGQWTEEVKLTFTENGQCIGSIFVPADATTFTCSTVTVPEGKTFAGWTVEETDANGRTVLRLMFTPDENGVVTLSAGTTLIPMTLSPLFE